MTVPGQSTRPLKKRRVVSIEADDHPRPRNQGTKAKKSKTRPRAAKKQKSDNVTPYSPSSPTDVIKKNVTWNDGAEKTLHSQPDASPLLEYLKGSDLWYTRENYKEFLLDRLQSIEAHQYITSNNMDMDDNESKHYCIRGLEVVQDDSTNEHYQSKKKLYHSTVIMEQVRQGLLGIKDPERFRTLVAPQSDLALHRAQELAAQDEREVYPFRTPYNAEDIRAKLLEIQRLSNGVNSIHSGAAQSDTNQSTWALPFEQQRNTTSSIDNAIDSCGAGVVSDVSSTGSNSSSGSSCESNTNGALFTESIRKLQERSMRRLMGIYQPNGEGTDGAKETNNLFRFAKKDSLLGIHDKNEAGNTPSHNSVWAASPEEPNSNSELIEQMMALIQQRQQLQQEKEQHEQQVAEQELIEQKIAEQKLAERKLIEQKIAEQKLAEQLAEQQLVEQQLKQQLAEQKLAEQQLVEQHLKQYLEQKLEQQQQQQQQATNSLLEAFLIQQQQHQQEHQNKMKLALMAMNTTRFNIRRDTLSHVQEDTAQ